MFNKTQKPEQRLQAYRAFRRDFPESGTALDVCEAFQGVEILPRYLDFYTPDSWPTVFDIVRQGLFCQSGVTLMMSGLLWYLKLLKSTDLELRAISNHDNGNQGLVLIDQDNCYNFLPGKIVTTQYVNDHSICLDTHLITSDKLFR